MQKSVGQANSNLETSFPQCVTPREVLRKTQGKAYDTRNCKSYELCTASYSNREIRHPW